MNLRKTSEERRLVAYSSFNSVLSFHVGHEINMKKQKNLEINM